MFLKVNDHTLYAELHGPENAPLVALLHHGLGSTRAWKEQVTALAGAGYRVLVYDRWGYGQSDPRPALDLPTFAQDVADLEAISLQLGVKRMALIGHSDGGTLALYYAVQNPQQVVCVVTIAAHIYIEPKMQPGIDGVKSTFQNDARFREGLRRTHGEKYRAVFNNWYDGWHRPECLSWDLRPVLRHVACPVLVVQGMQDEHASPQHARDIAQSIPGAELWLLPGAGHMLPQDNAETLNRRLIEFLTLTSSKARHNPDDSERILHG